MKIRKYKKGDEKGILKLDRLVEEHPWNRRNLKNWYWKYKGSNPFGKALVWVAEDNNKIVATFSLIPLNYYVNKKVILGACSIAMIVHPNYQNKGLIKFVADKLFNDAKLNNIKFIYGYPNQNAYDIHKQFFSYEDISQQKLFYKPVKFEKSIFCFKVEKINKFDEEINKFLKKIKDQRKVYLKRNKKFLNWRYTERPDYNYHLYKFTIKEKVCGYVVLKIYKEKELLRGHIIDIFYNNNLKIFNDIINFCEIFFYKKLCNEITFWLQGKIKEKNSLIKLGYSIKETRPFICKFLDIKSSQKKFLNKKNWYFTMGDTLEIY